MYRTIKNGKMIKQKRKSEVYVILIISVIASIFAACSSKSEANPDKANHPIVSVNQKTLYQADIETAIPEGLSAADSTTAADAYIKMWINDELIYEKAKQNVTDQDRINELVENYRQSLTVFTYLEQLLKEELSKKISESELKDYYDKHPESFELESSLVKGLFLKIPRSSNEVNNFRQWYQSKSESAKEKIEKASFQNAVIYDYFYDRWVNFDDIATNIPTPISNVDQFVKTNKNFETQDSLYVYLLHIEEYALSGTTAPYEYAKPQITDILINKHRESFLKQIETDLYKKATDADEIKFYQKKENNAKK